MVLIVPEMCPSQKHTIQKLWFLTIKTHIKLSGLTIIREKKSPDMFGWGIIEYKKLKKHCKNVPKVN